jgi:signal transduction histidine kinase
MALPNTLASRIIALSGIWILIVLVITAVMLVINHRDHTAQHYDAHVAMHFEELTSASYFTKNGKFQLAFNPSDPRYSELSSGWYWEVQQAGKSLQRSLSLGERSLSLEGILPTNDIRIYEISGPRNEDLRVHVVEMEIDPNHEPLVYIASAPLGGIKEDVVEYSNHIILSFAALGLGLMFAVVLQVRVALKPLQAISTRISDIRAGKAKKMPRDQLEDVRPLVDELNNLLDHNATLVKRARNQLGDLAHSVKNPLTVINNAAQDMSDEQKELVLQQTKDISRSVDHYLSRARTYGTEKVLGSRYSIRTAAEDLVYAMQRIYQERNLDFDLTPLRGCWFKGEGQDLEEMLGNLLDNACKWAKSQVRIGCSTSDDRLEILVEDDGPGIADEEYENVMRRGRRLDESKPGHGQGLGIVKDICALYGGQLKLSRSEMGGLQAKLELPSA